MRRFDAKKAAGLLAMGWIAGCAGHVVLVAEEPDAGNKEPESGITPTPEAGPEPTPEAGPDVPDSAPPNCTDLLPAEIRARRIVFDSDRAQNFARQIYVMNADGS